VLVLPAHWRPPAGAGGRASASRPAAPARRRAV